MQIRFVEHIPHADRDDPRGSITVICPWLKGLSPESGLWVAVLPIHDVNDFVDSEEVFKAPGDGDLAFYFGLFALDRFRSPTRLLAQLRRKGIERIVNVPSVSFFDGRSTSILESLGLGHEQEVAFLRQAKLQGFRVALCARRSTLGAIEDIGMFDAVLCHDGPRSDFSLRRSGSPVA
ncbi:MAG: phosphoenolpyruvate hydrolase family protein [Hyphomicrobiales bacterium]